MLATWLSLRILAAAFAVALSVSAASAQQDRAERIQAALDRWLAERAPIEKVTGVAGYVSFGDPGPAIEAFAGKIGRAATDARVDQDTLFQMGSTSKSFAAAVILKLEAAGKLSLDDTIGKWLPHYPAWKDVSVRRLLNMTSGIPNYSETEAMSRAWANDPARHFSAEELVALVYPTGVNDRLTSVAYHYSNTNYILAGMIAAKAAGKPYRDLVHELVIASHGLGATFYEDGALPDAVMRRMARGYFENPACADHQPKDCKPEDSWNKPMMGRDVRDLSVSWAQAAGGGIANARDVDRWMRAVFAGRVVPARQQGEWLRLVSTKTGRPIADVSADDPRGFSLGLARGILGSLGPQWFYQGETLGYRTLYVWFANDNLMIVAQTNSQPAGDLDKLHEVVATIYQAAKN